MSGANAEIVIKSIIGEIVQQCAARGHAVSDTLVTLTVKAVVLDPRNFFTVDRTLTKQDVQKLVELCLDKLTEECSPSLDTIKMQVYFDMNYTSRRELLEKIHLEVESKLSSVRREITDSRVQTQEELQALYHKIITYILLRSSMGSPTDVNTVQEAKVALQSIFPRTELAAFMVLLKKDKEQQLNELTMIVTGIRLFNKTSEKEKEETDFNNIIPAVLNEALAVTSKSIENELSVTQRLAWKYTAVLEKLTDSGSQPRECDVPIGLIKQALYNVRQHEVFLKVLLADACLCDRHVENLQTELASQMKLLKETVKSKRAVHTAQVFPLFKALSRVWSDLHNEFELLISLKDIMLNLQPFVASQAKIFSEAYLDCLLETSEVKTDEQRMTESSDECITPAEIKTQEWLLSETAASELPLQYNGVCGYTLVSRDGLLLPGNPQIGVFKHKDKLYAFSSKEAALKFASSPDDFIADVAEKAQLSPELTQLLRLDQQFSCVSLHSEMQPGESVPAKPATMSESGTQTDIHPVETNIVRSYEWNEWELRRKAIKLVDLCTKVTRSVQTDLSHMRRENATQTWLPKSAAPQSKKDGESNVLRPHLTDLRGPRDRDVKINLTRPVDE